MCGEGLSLGRVYRSSLVARLGLGFGAALYNSPSASSTATEAWQRAARVFTAHGQGKRVCGSLTSESGPVLYS